jgi:hypothetical protein
MPSIRRETRGGSVVVVLVEVVVVVAAGSTSVSTTPGIRLDTWTLAGRV